MKRKALLLLLCVLLLCIAGYSGYRLFLSWQEYTVSDQVYDELSQFVQFETSPKETEPSPVTTSPAEPTETAGTESSATNTVETTETTAPTETEKSKFDDIL